jgi:predicted dehydrogenase
MIASNGEYGCLGDLGMHACNIPFKAGWKIHNVRAILSNIIASRPDGKGDRVPCETWDNATLLCEASDSTEALHFPLTIKTQRIAPGEKNSWYIEILGTKTSARFSTKDPKRLSVLEYGGKEQAWQQIDMGHETAYKSITGGIFEFGFSDSILQMWAAFMNELHTGKPQGRFSGCVTPWETALSHKLFTAALQSNAQKCVVELT